MIHSKITILINKIRFKMIILIMTGLKETIKTIEITRAIIMIVVRIIAIKIKTIMIKCNFGCNKKFNKWLEIKMKFNYKSKLKIAVIQKNLNKFPRLRRWTIKMHLDSMILEKYLKPQEVKTPKSRHRSMDLILSKMKIRKQTKKINNL